VNSIPLNDLGRCVEQLRSEIDERVAEVLDSAWFVLGPQGRAFEAELTAYLGVPVLGVGNGTDALELAMRSTVTGRRRQVLCAANAGGYAATAARVAGLHPVYADVDPDTHVLTPETIEPRLTDEVGAVVVTHLYGRAAGVPEIVQLCRPRGIAVIEDCAQALGARTAGGAVGALGDVATFSFYPTKNLGALGDGGAVASGNAELLEQVRALRQYGWSQKYHVVTGPARNSRLDELQAGLLRVGLGHLDAWNEQRRAILSRYAAAAGEAVTVLPAVGESHVAHLGVIVCRDRDAARAALTQAGVGTDIHYPVPDHHQPAWAGDYPGLTLPVTERLAEQVLSVPLFPQLTEDEIQQVCAALGALR